MPDLGKFDMHAVEQAELLQECPMPLDTDHVGHLGRADVRRVDEDLRDGQHPPLAVEVVDGEARDLDRPRCIELVVQGYLA